MPNILFYDCSLVENPFCADTVTVHKNCILPQQPKVSYSTPLNCGPLDCDSDKVSSPNCHCAYPYTGIFTFRAPQFSDLENTTYYRDLEKKLMRTFNAEKAPVDSVSLSNISRSSSNYLEMTLQVFPRDHDRFNRTAILTLGFLLSNQTFKPPSDYGPYYFTANDYTTFAGNSISKTINLKNTFPSVISYLFFNLYFSFHFRATCTWIKMDTEQDCYHCNCRWRVCTAHTIVCWSCLLLS